MEPIYGITDTPNSLKEMVFLLITDMGAEFTKKKIGFTTGHNETTNEKSLHPELKERLTSKGIRIENCSYETFDNYDVIIISNPLKSFNEDEQDALFDYIHNGGSVIIFGIGYYWTVAKDENGDKRKIEDYPINRLGKRLGFRIEASYKGKLLEYKEETNKVQLYFTPLQLPSNDLDQFATPNVRVQMRWGTRFETGDHILKSQDYALYWYKMAAFEKDAEAQYRLAVLYLNSNLNLAPRWFQFAYENGSNRALGRLGLM
jgi:hypothetical protein